MDTVKIPMKEPDNSQFSIKVAAYDGERGPQQLYLMPAASNQHLPTSLRRLRGRVPRGYWLTQYLSLFLACSMVMLIMQLQIRVWMLETTNQCETDPSYWVAFRASCYIDRRDKERNYAEALADCNSLGAQIAMPRDFAEYIMLYTLATGTKELSADMMGGEKRKIPDGLTVRPAADRRSPPKDTTKDICTFWASKVTDNQSRFAAFDCEHKGYHICVKDVQMMWPFLQ